MNTGAYITIGILWTLGAVAVWLLHVAAQSKGGFLSLEDARPRGLRGLLIVAFWPITIGIIAASVVHDIIRGR
jgi:hypothetical protein